MAFKLFQNAMNKARTEYMSHVSPEFMEWLDSKEILTEADVDSYFDRKGMNSYERELMYPKLDDAALLRFANNCLGHCEVRDRPSPCRTYDESFMLVFGPMLIKRLEKYTVADGKP